MPAEDARAARELADEERASALRAGLGAWFARHARDLPWRRTRDPYAIWISEAMLQQTRVETVIPYWERFLERFPTVAALADADEEELLAAWSGLGYYRRVRALKRAARELCDRFDGRFPRALDDALSLSGVGRYTAGAVLSIAHGEPVPLVDGNVLRVFARLFALTDPVGSRELERTAWALAERLLPGPTDPVGPGDWNQALMELGATVCVPREPRCLACPVRASCAAAARGLTLELPRKRPRPAPIDVELEVLVAERDGALLVRRRPPTGRMAGLWELPTRELPEDGSEPRLFPLAAAPELAPGRELGTLRHGITRHRIRARVLAAELREGSEPRDHVWLSPEALADLGLTGMTKKVLRLAAVRDLTHGAGRAASDA